MSYMLGRRNNAEWLEAERLAADMRWQRRMLVVGFGLLLLRFLSHM